MTNAHIIRVMANEIEVHTVGTHEYTEVHRQTKSKYIRQTKNNKHVSNRSS